MSTRVKSIYTSIVHVCIIWHGFFVHKICRNNIQIPVKILCVNVLDISYTIYNSLHLLQYRDTRILHLFTRMLNCSAGYVIRIINEYTPYWALQCRDAYWVESFNHQFLIYIPKHIHFYLIMYVIVTVHCIVEWKCV